MFRSWKGTRKSRHKGDQAHLQLRGVEHLSRYRSAGSKIEPRWCTYKAYTAKVNTMTTTATGNASAARSWRAYEELCQRAELIRASAAAITIQAWARAFICQRELSRLKVRAFAATIIQSRVRRWRGEMEQSFERKRQERNRHSAIVKIQSLVRGFTCKRRNMALSAGVVAMQARVRGNRGRSSIEKVARAALKIQCSVRAMLQK